MRALSSTMLASIAQTITDPVYLFKIDFDSQYVYATSREAITYDGNNYITQGAQIKSLDSQRLSFTLPNHDRSISALAFAGRIQGLECTVYLQYDGETIGRFVGLLDAPQCSGDYNSVLLTVVDIYAVTVKWPNVRMRKPTFNFLPAPGTILDFGTTHLTLEKDS